MKTITAEAIVENIETISDFVERELEAVDGLIKTGPTGTNVNDIAIALSE